MSARPPVVPVPVRDWTPLHELDVGARPERRMWRAAEVPGHYPAAMGGAEADPAAAGEESLAALAGVIAARVREYRARAGLSVAELARRTALSKGMLSKMEHGQTSPSLSTLVRVAAALDVPVTALFRGFDEEHEAVFTPAGHGAQIVRRGTRVGHDYRLLGALRGVHKRMEPVLCELTESSEVFPLFQHAGTEFLYVLQGVMVYGVGGSRYRMSAGDALQFDGEAPHGPAELVTLPVRFLSVTAFGHVPNG